MPGCGLWCGERRYGGFVGARRREWRRGWPRRRRLWRGRKVEESGRLDGVDEALVERRAGGQVGVESVRVVVAASRTAVVQRRQVGQLERHAVHEQVVHVVVAQADHVMVGDLDDARALLEATIVGQTVRLDLGHDAVVVDVEAELAVVALLQTQLDRLHRQSPHTNNWTQTELVNNTLLS